MADVEGRVAWLFSAFAASLCILAVAAQAQPSRIILLRHAEKASAYKLCGVGGRRADALAAQYLGKGATKSLFTAGQAPVAFLGVTLHALETITPAAQTWGLPVIDYSVVPGENDNEGDDAKEAQLARRTQEAARDLLSKPEFNGKIVVISWEHKHIANKKLEQDITLRQLLGLADVKGVPDTWPGDNYDYFWIIDYAPSKSTPSGFVMVKQAFAKPYDDLPSNDWADKEQSKTAEKDNCKE
jgi:hypothetical protein